MKKLFIAAIMSLSLLMTGAFAEIKMGIILGFTGPIESLTPAMRDSAKLAFQEASDSGALLGGETITVLEADSTCVDSAAATICCRRSSFSRGCCYYGSRLFRCYRSNCK